jgi:hypothetical protein
MLEGIFKTTVWSTTISQSKYLYAIPMRTLVGIPSIILDGGSRLSEKVRGIKVKMGWDFRLTARELCRPFARFCLSIVVIWLSIILRAERLRIGVLQWQSGKLSLLASLWSFFIYAILKGVSFIIVVDPDVFSFRTWRCIEGVCPQRYSTPNQASSIGIHLRAAG